HNYFRGRAFVASLPKLNRSQQPPDGDEQSGEVVPPLPWATTNTGQGTGGSIFAIPAGPPPEEIPGFPFPPGSMMGGQNQPAQAPPMPQAPARRNGSIQPLSGMAIPGGPTTTPHMPQPTPLPTPPQQAQGGQQPPANYQLNQAHTNTGRL